MTTTYNIGTKFTEKQFQLIVKSLEEHNNDCDEAIKLANYIRHTKLIKSNDNKIELNNNLNIANNQIKELRAELYGVNNELDKLKNTDHQKAISEVWQKYHEKDEENEVLRKFKFDNDKGKNPLEDELKSIKNDLESCQESLKFYKENYHKLIEIKKQNKEKITELENNNELEKPANKKLENYYFDYINSNHGNHDGWQKFQEENPFDYDNELKNPHKKYHNDYDKKTYTFFITEDKLDCMNKGLELLKDYDNWPEAKNTFNFINQRIGKIKNKVKSQLISMNGVDNPNLANELSDY
tara:strand:- start:267 stop:1157 length:891 start_codon:yes stop_codon:yes gene_type:complete